MPVTFAKVIVKIQVAPFLSPMVSSYILDRELSAYVARISAEGSSLKKVSVMLYQALRPKVIKAYRHCIMTSVVALKIMRYNDSFHNILHALK